MYTSEIWTGTEWMSPTAIDREVKAMCGKMLDSTATEADKHRLEKLQAVRRNAMIPRRVPAAHRRMKKIAVSN